MLRIRQLLFIFIGLFSTYSPILNGVVALYPASGYRHSASGAFFSTGVDGRSWSCAVSGVNVYFLWFNATVVQPTDSNYRAFGRSVRCVQNLRYVCFSLCVL